MFGFVVVNQFLYRDFNAVAIKQNTTYDNTHDFDHVCTDVNSHDRKFQYKQDEINSD